ncbi:hypothetical protein AVEN_26151-1 [Araneus ventricosus]|uniref:Uncharacterized protein n=1 Tax=Araneus ventricosus TaxID=182803 RepID=A0A4Y2EMZ8_ARAVE|nr:hypothetical protein AVEN_26151-1 [Araneus ventricosus]
MISLKGLRGNDFADLSFKPCRHLKAVKSFLSGRSFFNTVIAFSRFFLVVVRVSNIDDTSDFIIRQYLTVRVIDITHEQVLNVFFSSSHSLNPEDYLISPASSDRNRLFGDSPGAVTDSSQGQKLIPSIASVVSLIVSQASASHTSQS